MNGVILARSVRIYHEIFFANSGCTSRRRKKLAVGDLEQKQKNYYYIISFPLPTKDFVGARA
jgi:hypothetical protein